jgi:hypothetical protein
MLREHHGILNLTSSNVGFEGVGGSGREGGGGGLGG